MAELVNRIDYSFIAAREGTRKDGYVPTCTVKSVANKNSWCYNKPAGIVMGRSGVTVGTGFDIGQHNEYDLNRLKLSKGLHDKLKPYLLKRKMDAQKALVEKPLVLTETEIAELNKAVKQNRLNKISERYKNETGVNFLSLPAEAQTAISSYLFQKGENINNEVWKAFTKQDWQKASALMKAESDGYKTRRELEAGLLDKLPAASI